MENFNAMAKDYDTQPRAVRANTIADKIRTRITSGQEKSAIEFGCGTGLVGLQLLNAFISLNLIDSSPEMINQVNQKLENLNTQTASALCCDLMNTIPEIPPVDYIFSSLVLHHIQDTETVLRRLYSLLNHGGHLIIIDIDEEDGSFHAKYPDFEGHNGFNHAALGALAKKAGFANITIETFYHDSKTHNGKENPYSLFIFDAVK